MMRMLRGLYEWVMEKAAHPHAQWWLALFAFAESSFFPIPPHPLLGLMCLAEPKKAVRFAVICIAASVLGGIFGYAIGSLAYDAIGEWLINALGLTEAFPKAACYLRENDWQTILIAGTTPVPFKLLTITAGFISMNFLTFVLASIGGRGFVFMVVGLLFQIFGAPIKTFIDKYLGWLTALFTVLVIAGFIAITQLGGDDGEADANDPCANITSIDQL